MVLVIIYTGKKNPMEHIFMFSFDVFLFLFLNINGSDVMGIQNTSNQMRNIVYEDSVH